MSIFVEELSLNGSAFPFGIILAIIATFTMVAVIAFVIISDRREKKRRFDDAAALGLQPVPNSEFPGIKQLLADVNPRFGKSYMELRYVFTKEIPEGKLFLYDLWDISGEDNTLLHKQSVLLVVPGINLPTFVISVRVQIPGAPGMLMNFANKMMTWSMQHTLPAVEFPEYPEYNQKFNTFTNDPDRLRNILDGSTLGRLAMQKDLFLAGGKGSLVYAPNLNQRNDDRNNDELINRINSALSIMRIFLHNVA